MEHKRSVARTLLRRTNIISTEEDKLKEISYVKRTLGANGYESWIYRALNSANKKGHLNSNPSIYVPQIGLPYIKNISEKLRRIFGKYGVRVYHKPYNTIKSLLVHPKDKTDQCKKCGVIYKVVCSDCKEEYIGETGRQLGTRLLEHRKPNSALAEHQSSTGHAIDWDSASILDEETKTIPRKIKEAIKIKKYKPKLNRDNGWDLPNLYGHLL